MPTIRSSDGTVIAFDRYGTGPPIILVDGALCYRGSGPMPKLAAQLAPHFTVFTYDRRGRGDSGDTPPYAVEREVEDIAALVKEAGGSAFVYGTSSGAALSLEAANRGLGIARLGLYEAPFIVDGTRPPIPEDFVDQLRAKLAAGRPGDAVRLFMGLVGMPGILVSLMRFFPGWSKLEALAPTLVYDITLVKDHERGRPLSSTKWSSVRMPTLVVAGGKSPAWMQNAMRALVGVLPNARHHTLPGQDHMVSAKALAPVLVDFFADGRPPA